MKPKAPPTCERARPGSLQNHPANRAQVQAPEPLELALHMGVSQRHGTLWKRPRAQPRTAAELAARITSPAGAAQRGTAAGGFAPVYRGSELADAVLAPVRDALAQLLQARPMPAMVMDAAWNVLHMNRGARWLATTLLPWMADLPPASTST